MIEFRDGPAGGQLLMLRRAPIYLRVVRTQRGEWDALDQLTDEPKPREQLTVYRCAEKSHPTHFKFTKRGASGWYANAVYEVVAEQPDDETVRDKAKWRQWCREQQQRDKAAAEATPI